MLLRFFKKSYLPQLVSLILLATVWWLPGALNILKSGGPPTGAHWNIPPVAGIFTGFVLFLTSAFLANHIAAVQKLTDRNSYLTALFFILAGCSTGLWGQSVYFLSATFFFLLFYQKVFRFQNTPHIITTAFDAGFYLGITSLFYPPAIGLVIFLWIALIIYQTDQWRPYATAIIGWALPWFFLFSGYFLFGKTQPLIHYFTGSFHFRTNVYPFSGKLEMFLFLWVALLTLTALLRITGMLSGFNISKRQHALTAVWGLLFTAIVLFLFDVPLQSLILLSGPVALILGMYFSHIRKTKWSNLVVWFWLLFIFVHQYLPLFYVA